MRKFLSVIFFAVALTGTWSLIHSNPSVGFETHTGIQEKLITLITETVAAKKPQSKDFAITKLWTETLGDNKVRAVFAYRFIELGSNQETLEQMIEGEAILHREPSATENVDRWVIQSVRTTNDAVTFAEGMTVTPVAGENESDETLAPSNEVAPAATPVPPPVHQ